MTHPLDSLPIWSDYEGLRAYSPEKLLAFIQGKDAEIERLCAQLRQVQMIAADTSKAHEDRIYDIQSLTGNPPHDY